MDDLWTVKVIFESGVTWTGYRANFFDARSVPAALVAEARETYPGQGDVAAIWYNG